MKTNLRVGIASFGMSGKVFHAPLITAHPRMELAWVHERNSQKSKVCYPNVEVVPNFEDLISINSLDLLVVNTPQHLHYEMCKKALLARKHVVVEKPFTVTTDEAKELINISKKEKKVLAVFQNRRWDGDFLTVQKIVKNNLLGKVVTFENHFDRYRNYIQENTWKEEDDLPGAGLLYNLGPHLIDQAICLFGLPDAVQADIRIVRPGGKVDDYFHLTLYYNDVRVNIRSSYLVREPYPRFALHGTHGSFIKYGLDPQEEDLKTGRDPREDGWGADMPEYYGLLNTDVNGLHFKGHIETLPGDYMAFYNNVYEAITEGKELLVNPEEPMHNISIIEAAFESNKTKRTILLNYSEI